MPKAAPIQDNFSGGEFSPTFYGRVTAERYRTGLKTCFNYFPLVQGPVTRRPGTRFVDEIKDSETRSRLIPYVVSQTQAYQLEFGDSYIRFYRNYALILSGPPYEVVTPFGEADLADIFVIPSIEGLIILHPLYPPKLLSRITDTSWSFGNILFLDGPYLPMNQTSTTLTPSAASGAVTITASSQVGINDGAGFQPTDVGRLIRLKHTGASSWLKINSFTDATHVTATVQNGAGTTATATGNWRLGLWGDTNGYPSSGCFYEDRLSLAGGNIEYPLRIDLSRTGDYFNFSPTDLDADSTVTATHALALNLNSSQGNFLRWVMSNEKGLLAGTAGSEFTIRPSSEGEALSATNIVAKEPSDYGSAAVPPVKVGTGSVFVSPTGKRIREMLFNYQDDGFRSPDRTLLADHITGPGVEEMVVQKEPLPLLWCRRSDGLLATMTYERDADVLVVGWARHQIGGSSDEDASPAVVESISVIPSPDGKVQDVWMIVRRVFGNDFPLGYTTKRYIEYITTPFTQLTKQRDAFYVDCGLTYDNPVTISSVTSGDVIFTAAVHGLEVGDFVWIEGIVGMNLLNNRKYRVSEVLTTETFKLEFLDGTEVSGNQLGTYVSGGTFREYITTISGLSHLENLPPDAALNSQLKVFADGAVQACEGGIVGGILTLDYPATVVHIGIKYASDGQRLPDEAGAADGTASGKTRRTNRVGFNVQNTLGVKFGTAFETRELVLEEGAVVPTEVVSNPMDEIPFRNTEDYTNAAVPLFSGIKSEQLEADYDMENEIAWRQEDPFPGTILSILPQMQTQDR